MRVWYSPRVLWGAFGFSALAGGVTRVLEQTYPGTDLARAVSTGYQPLYVLANAIALRLCLKIGSDHGERSTMRLAWRLMAASCGVTILRHSFEWITFLVGWHQTPMLNTLVSLRQIPTVLAMVLLGAALAAMWSSYAAVGMGMRFRGRDALFACIILGLMALGWVNREGFHDARSAYAAMRYLQSTSPILLALPALLCLVLQRISDEMEGGRFAVALRYLAWSLLLRLVSLEASFVPPVSSLRLMQVAGAVTFWASPWLLALAIVHRWRLTISLRDLADIYAANPQEGMAHLVPEFKK